MDSDLIRQWASLCESAQLVSEQTTPSGVDDIMASFDKDVSDRKFSPSKEFLEAAYTIFNRRFFQDSLPVGLIFSIKVQPTESYIGQAWYEYNRASGRVRATAITLNGARTLTLHEWLEVVLHEIIHVLDYETNPNSFTGRMRKAYDPHGWWFMNEGKKFDKYGFHVQKYCDAVIGVDDSNTKVRNRIKNSVFLYMQGSNSRPLIMKMTRNTMDKNLRFILLRIERGSSFGIGVKEIKVMTSENPNIALLSDLRMKDSSSKISWWWFTDKFQEKYGPFKEEDSVKVSSSKTKTDMEYLLTHLDEDEDSEDAIGQIFDKIEDVETVKDIGNDKLIVSIP